MLARRDPLTKLLVALALAVLATLSQRTWPLALMMAAILAWLLVAERIRPARLARAMLPFVFFAATTSWVYVIAPNPASATPGSGWAVAFLVALRTLAIGAVSIAFAATTEPADLARALVARAGLPRRFVYGTLGAVQFLPALAEEARMARLIARAAAAGKGAGWLRLRLAGLSPALGLALLAGAIRRAGSAAIAMELRGLSEARSPLRWRVPAFTTADALFAAACGAAVLAVLLAPA